MSKSVLQDFRLLVWVMVLFCSDEEVGCCDFIGPPILDNLVTNALRL